ncbi:restriction endonuclease S subunit [Methanolobus tindarius DSM 2278]|uniref:Restriction endonuclease S subunit n=1 Tax=Methanolobus tindarius DSM 2278 TaxID=1090322 RepID=W9DQV9_METTI|nr:restriction endonuclease subunit S [Methanolobus tindarius]ETA67810.1 restriction endonuclease S subunit [Methanolobus tindarius DSM 2278]
MNTSLFFDNFSIVADSPNGVQKLREMILQLAVMGKLVPQNPNDETASVLVEMIKAEKTSLAKQGIIKKTKSLPFVQADEISYEIPESWYWTRLGNIGIVNPRNNVSDDLDVSFVPMNLISEKYGEDAESENRIWKDIKKGYTHFAENDVVMAKITPCFQNGKSTVMKGLCNSIGAGTTELHVFRSVTDYVNPDYVVLYLKSPHYIETGITKMTGSAGQKRVPRDYFAHNPFPLPPLEEQKRIVAKVDQLMAMCGELEAFQQQKNESRIHLNKAALNGLLNADSADEFNELWQLIYSNFDLLYDNLDNVAKFKEAILQLAVMGKLVPQDSNDEPTSVLLERIEDEKKRLMKEGIISLKNLATNIVVDDIPYQIPHNWAWFKLNDLVYNFGQKKPDSKFTYIDVASINKEKGLISDNVKTILPDDAPSRARKIVKRGCVIYSTVRPYLLNTAIVDDDYSPEPIASTAFAVLNPYSGLLNKYLHYYLRSQHFVNYVESQMMGMAYPAINDTKLYKGLVPLPPLEEQKRIVAKVDELMAICDELETRISKAQENSEKLTNAVVNSVVE